MDRLRGDEPARHFTVFLLLFFITLSRYGLSIGFTLKIYMFYLIFLFAFYIRSYFFRTLYHYEIFLLLFYFTYCVSGAFSQYPGASIRIILGVLLVLGFYFIMRFIMDISSIQVIENAIGNAGIAFNSISLLLYAIGLLATSGVPGGIRMTSYGLLLDRDYPRLVGLLDDPNIFLFYNTIFFFWFLTNIKGVKNSIGLVLCITTSLLTFSRGGLIAIMIVVVLYVLVSNFSKKLPVLIASAVCLALLSVALSVTKFDFNKIITSRISDVSTDGGSGRFDLWSEAISYFLTKPILGIGAFTFSEHYEFYHDKTYYVHNTYIEILAESGIIGFLFYMTFLLMLVLTLFKTRIYMEKPFIVLTLFAFLLQIVSLSLIINEAFFCYLAITLKYIIEYEKKGAGISLEQRN